MTVFEWLPCHLQGKSWCLYCKTRFSGDRGILLGNIYWDGEQWRCSNFRFRTGMETGQFEKLRDAAKWLLGYDMRPIKGLRKYG